MYRFSQVASAIGITEAALRSWLTRHRIDVGTNRPEGGWRSFDSEDVYKLAVVAEMLKFGLTVTEAYQALTKCLEDTAHGTVSGLPDFLYARPDKDGWRLLDKPMLPVGEGNPRSLLLLLPQRIANEASMKLEAMGSE